jgi:proteic killer suppression protein
VIASFKDKQTEKAANGERVKAFESIARPAQRKLAVLAAAESLDDLAAVPGNRLEALKGDREGQHSIRVNDQYRICFTWKEKYDVEITDYH